MAIELKFIQFTSLFLGIADLYTSLKLELEEVRVQEREREREGGD